MTREQFEHVVRAAAAVLGADEVIVIGSQAIHGSIEPDRLPPAAMESVEADILPMDGDEAKADLVDGSIGELSMFHETFGVYGQGVGPTTAKLAPGWRERLVSLSGPGTKGATAWCLERHDLVASKLIAGRDKDQAFYRALVDAGLVDPAVVVERIRGTVGIDEIVRSAAVEIALAG